MPPRTIEAAVKAKCMDCCGGSRILVGQCFLKKCPLWNFRGVEATDEVPEEIEGETVIVAKVTKADKSEIPETSAVVTRKVEHHVDVKPRRRRQVKQQEPLAEKVVYDRSTRLRNGRRSAEEIRAEALLKNQDVIAALSAMLK